MNRKQNTNLNYNFLDREEIEVLKERKLLSQATWSGSTFHTFEALNEKVFCPKLVLTIGSVILFLTAHLLVLCEWLFLAKVNFEHM